MHVAVEVVLGQILVLVGLARNDQGLSFVHELHGLFIAGDEVQNLIAVDEVGRADLMTLRQGNNIAAIEIAVVFVFRMVVCVYL